jgi:hypothetical protein
VFLAGVGQAWAFPGAAGPGQKRAGSRPGRPPRAAGGPVRRRGSVGSRARRAAPALPPAGRVAGAQRNGTDGDSRRHAERRGHAWLSRIARRLHAVAKAAAASAPASRPRMARRAPPGAWHDACEPVAQSDARGACSRPRRQQDGRHGPTGGEDGHDHSALCAHVGHRGCRGCRRAARLRARPRARGARRRRDRRADARPREPPQPRHPERHPQHA